MNNFDQNELKKPFELTYNADGVYLTVNRNPYAVVEEVDVINEIRYKKIRNFNAAIISETVKKAMGQPVKIADKQEEEKVDAVVEVVTSPDKMKAFIKIREPEGGGKPAASGNSMAFEAGWYHLWYH